MKVEIPLTRQQMKALQPIFAEVEKIANGGGELGSVLGQVWGPGEHREGIASFHFLNPKQATIVHRAIKKALEVK